MFEKIILFSIRQKLIIIVLVLGLITWGLISLRSLPLDAIPDVTNNQVNVVTIAPNLAPLEMEQFVTYPVELAMQNIAGLENVRSVSQFGLSIITLEFKDNIDVYWARNQVNERLLRVKEEIPKGFGSPELLPLTTGLGEIFQYTLQPTDPHDTTWTLMRLRELQDWTIKRQLLGTEGVAEVSSFGGYLKQFQIQVDPQRLKSLGVTLHDVFKAAEQGNQNTGATYLEKNNNIYFIRGVGLASSIADLENIFIHRQGGVNVAIRDVATVTEGVALRFGALVQNENEACGGIVMMLRGENSRQVVLNVKERLAKIEKTLPKGIKIVPFLDRELLIDRTIATVSKNLLEGGLIVIFVLVLLLGHLRAGLIVASVIPLAMLFAVGMMVAFGVSGNLMSLGAIDFGLLVDGAVIVVENAIFRLHHAYPKIGTQKHFWEDLNEKETTIFRAAHEILQSAIFGSIIIMIVYVPLLLLQGIEGKMFKPMALTVIFALMGAFILSLTYVPMMSALFLKAPKKGEATHKTFADRLILRLKKIYFPLIKKSLQFKKTILIATLAIFFVAFGIFQRMGGEFIPQLDEGDFVVEVRMMSGTSLTQMIETSKTIGKLLLKEFPHEIQLVTPKIGTAEIPSDPMSVEEMDVVLTMKSRDVWQRVKTREQFENELDKVLAKITGVFVGIQQPIAMRFNELMTGAKTDVIVKVLGNDLDELAKIGNRIVQQISNIDGAQDIGVAKAEGMAQLNVHFRRDKMLHYGFTVDELSNTLRMAMAGEKAGVLFDENKRFDIVVKLKKPDNQHINDIENLLVTNTEGVQIPMRELADIRLEKGPMAVLREGGERCINVNLNVRGRDVASVVKDIQQRIEEKIKLSEGYRISYGGQFENLENAQKRLAMVVPAALILILLLLYFTFGNIREAILIFTAIPLAAVGGVLTLALRGMPFSISAGVGFIALFGVAVLNGMVLIGRFQQLENEGWHNISQRILRGVLDRFRPVAMTALVASFGFLPMAIATGAGAEVQKPLATVVIGGLVSSTLLTLIVLPILYAVFNKIFVKR